MPIMRNTIAPVFLDAGFRESNSRCCRARSGLPRCPPTSRDTQVVCKTLLEIAAKSERLRDSAFSLTIVLLVCVVGAAFSGLSLSFQRDTDNADEPNSL
jgi:hypothetical protein